MTTHAVAAPRSGAGRFTDLALLLLLATLWGGSYSFIRIGVETIPPLTLIAARTLLAGAILLVVIRWRGLRLPRDLATWRLFLAQACLNSVVPFTLIAWAERSVEAGLATILSSTSPIFVVLLTCLSATAERLPRLRLAGIAAGLAGTLLIVGEQAMAGFGEQLAAQLALVAASLCYAGAALFGRNFKGLDPLMPAAGSLICGAVVLLPLSLILDRPWTLSPSAASIQSLVGLFHRARLRDLFPADRAAGLGRDDICGLSARAHGGADRHGRPRRGFGAYGLGRARPRRWRRPGDDAAGAKAARVDLRGSAQEKTRGASCGLCRLMSVGRSVMTRAG
jgi:drug/metabolite transporter (DMT)-like permease